MSSLEIISALKAEKKFLQKEFGMEEIGVFGSCARGDMDEDSDLDIIVAMKADYSLFAGLYLHLGKKYKHKIDLVHKGKHFSKRFINFIKADVIYV